VLKKIIYILFTIAAANFAVAQQVNADSLKEAVINLPNDTSKLILLGRLTDFYVEINPDSAYNYANKMLPLAQNLNLKLEEVYALGEMGYAALNMGNYPRSLQNFLSAIAIAEDPDSEKNILPAHYHPIDEFTDRSMTPRLQRFLKLSRIHQYTAILYRNANNYEKSFSHFFESREWAKKSGSEKMFCIVDISLGRTYLNVNKIDSALLTEQNAYDIAVKINFKKYLGSILFNMGLIHSAKGNSALAGQYFKRAIIASTEQHYYRGIIASDLALAELYNEPGNKDSSLYFIKASLPIAVYLDAPDLLLRSYTALADYYRREKANDSAVKYQVLIIKIKDSLFNSKQAQQFQNIDFDEQQRQQQIEAAKAAYRIKWRLYLLVSGLAVFLFIAIILWRNSRQRKKANLLLSRQKEKLETALSKLQLTQNQLVHSEKMASLGELTAGIAHEIQNPLNFINNFSEVNTELVEEMKNELNSGNTNEAISIANDVHANELKINHHGKRADAIVKNMLQHSRSSTGVKEPTNINNLAEEYLRLSYHGLRAKEKSFNAGMQTDFDNSIGEINIIPQDIGRVLLNLFTNAFYAVAEKKKQQPHGYEPLVTVSTKRLSSPEFIPPKAGGDGDKIEIRVKDNGPGISEKNLNKVFQPFFTTRPTGEGTGLGLSLSYDIITKGHGGEIKAETKEGEGAEFIIELPIV
jgi:signal transduction histidine kinase